MADRATSDQSDWPIPSRIDPALFFSRGINAPAVPLQELDFFRRVRVDPEAGTLAWPNGVDFCPDVLYSEATETPIHVKEPA